MAQLQLLKQYLPWHKVFSC